MFPDERDHAVLVDMLGFAREVVAFSRGRKREDLDSDRALLRSLERPLELVGECARRISVGTREASPSIGWREIIGMRNIIAHEYGRIDPDELRTTAIRDASVLVSNLEAIVVALPPPQ